MTILEISLSIITAVLIFMIWRLTRHQECIYHDNPEGDIESSLHALAGATHGTLLAGNTVDLIRDEHFFSEITDAINRAEKTVHLETFLWAKGKASDLVVDALLDASKRDLWVRVIVDARGGSNMGKDTRKRLEEGGVELYNFHTISPMNFGRFNIRDHRKILVIDGTLAFVGGHCIKDHWLEDQDDFSRFQDVTAKFTGPIVGAIQSTFALNWAEAAEQHFLDQESFPPLEPTGDISAHVAAVKADNTPSSVQILHYLVIALAKKSIRIQNPYFLPDACGLKALKLAVDRGVDVQIMTPSPDATDSTYVTYAGRKLYDDLLSSGVRIHEYKKTLLHQKVITIDGKWAGIGSSNFDDRSFEINNEITVGIDSEKIAGELDQLFEDNLKHCEKIKLEEWRKRALIPRVKERVCHLFHEQF
ncbi:cardiolipin synthase B [Oceaniferula spumae]|uniref:Cardiolipin synthase B n=1 Tax=Oceaniferula spumae TaxID=2979115 RepID=A0AAT9FKL5_9BACT